MSDDKRTVLANQTPTKPKNFATAEKLATWINWTIKNNRSVIVAQAEGGSVHLYFDNGCIFLKCGPTDAGTWEIQDAENP